MKQNLLKTVLLLCALVAGTSSVWADYETAATFESSEVVSASSYNSYETDDWTLTFGGNSRSMGTNKNKASGCRISSNYGTEASTSNIATAAISKNKLNHISQITFVYEGGSGNSGSIYFAYSTDGSTWNAITLTSGTQGASTPEAGTTMTVQFAEISSAYYAVILDKGNATAANFRYDDVTITFDEAVVNSPLASIAVDASGATTVFHVGDSFTHEGATVIATYEDESTKDVTADATFITPDMSSAGTKTVNVSYTENEVEKTTSYDITVNAPATLTSITLSGSYPTEFTEGDTFSSEGIVVTANYDDDTKSDVTTEAAFSGYDLSNAGDQTVTVSYGGETATYDITVNEYVQPMSVTINMNYEWLGTEKAESLTTSDLPLVKNDYRVTTTITEGSNNQPRGDETYIRVYGGSTMTFEAPAGYVITSLEFATGGDNSWNAPTVEDGILSDKTWEGCASSVTFTMTAKCFIASVDITLAVKATTNASGYGTFASNRVLDFTDDTSFSAWQITGISGSTIYFSQIKGAVAAGTGVLLSGPVSATIGIPIAESGTDISATNKLVGITAATAVEADQYYGLSGNEFVPVNAGTVPASKALLPVSAITSGAGEAKALTFVFSDASGIDTVREMNVNDGAIYNLAGQKMQKLQKGINIVNGKKIFVK